MAQRQSGRLKLTKRQWEMMDVSIHDPERREEFLTGYIPINADWDEWTLELADRDGYEPWECRMWQGLRRKFTALYREAAGQ